MIEKKYDSPGQPTTFTQEIADEICQELAEGKSLRTVCEPEHMPAVKTIFNWMRTNEQFLQQYTRAKQESADAMAEEILDIADEASNKIMGDDKSDGARLQAERLRIETRKFLMAKMKPKKYGDKLDLTSDGKRISTTPIIVSEIKARKRDEEDAETETETTAGSRGGK